MDFNSVCRTCLGTKYLNPIFKTQEHHERFSVAMMNTTGLKVELNDGLPQNICRDCMWLINKSLMFRVHCKESETKLLQIVHNEETAKNEVFFDDENNIRDITIHVNIPQENDVKTENPDVELEIMYSSDDEKPLTDLFDKQNENFNTENSFDIKKKESNENIKNVTILENTIVDTKLFIETNTDYNCLENSKNKTDSTEASTTVLYKTETEDLKCVKDEKRKVICRICKKILSIRSVDAHMNRRHPGADERKVKCELCDTYVLRAKLNRHSQMMHGKDCSICKYCKLELNSKEALVEHAAICTLKKRKRKSNDMGKEMSECDICHKSMQKASLKMHQRIKHAGLGPVCDYCGRKFGSKFRLNEHLRSKHGYDKYKCTQCPFQSASSLALANHERRHRGETPFVCEVCGARFHAAYLLAQHAQSHRARRPMQCDLCPASFKANNSLHMHKMACHSTSRYKCTLCERAYSCRHYAVKHLRSVHRYSGPVPPLLQRAAV